MAHNTGVGR